jgi:hypothetical protein
MRFSWMENPSKVTTHSLQAYKKTSNHMGGIDASKITFSYQLLLSSDKNAMSIT